MAAPLLVFPWLLRATVGLRCPQGAPVATWAEGSSWGLYLKVSPSPPISISSHILSILTCDVHSTGVAQGVWDLFPRLSHSSGGSQPQQAPEGASRGLAPKSRGPPSTRWLWGLPHGAADGTQQCHAEEQPQPSPGAERDVIGPSSGVLGSQGFPIHPLLQGRAQLLFQVFPGQNWD